MVGSLIEGINEVNIRNIRSVFSNCRATPESSLYLLVLKE